MLPYISLHKVLYKLTTHLRTSSFTCSHYCLPAHITYGWTLTDLHHSYFTGNTPSLSLSNSGSWLTTHQGGKSWHLCTQETHSQNQEMSESAQSTQESKCQGLTEQFNNPVKNESASWDNQEQVVDCHRCVWPEEATHDKSHP